MSPTNISHPPDSHNSEGSVSRRQYNEALKAIEQLEGELVALQEKKQWLAIQEMCRLVQTAHAPRIILP